MNKVSRSPSTFVAPPQKHLGVFWYLEVNNVFCSLFVSENCQPAVGQETLPVVCSVVLPTCWEAPSPLNEFYHHHQCFRRINRTANTKSLTIIDSLFNDVSKLRLSSGWL